MTTTPGLVLRTRGGAPEERAASPAGRSRARDAAAPGAATDARASLAQAERVMQEATARLAATALAAQHHTPSSLADRRRANVGCPAACAHSRARCYPHP